MAVHEETGTLVVEVRAPPKLMSAHRAARNESDRKSRGPDECKSPRSNARHDSARRARAREPSDISSY
jgi:hypothetical protein